MKKIVKGNDFTLKIPVMKMVEGQQKTTLWLGSYQLEVDCDKAIQLLSALEMYALECFNVTAAHKKAVTELDNIEAVLTYDYRSGYPKMLEMSV